MDIMAPGGWLRIRREAKLFVISCPDNSFLDKAMRLSEINVNTWPSVDHGFHMYECRIRLESMPKLMTWLTDSMNAGEPESVKCHEPYARARLNLFGGLSHPEYDNVSEQEYAAGASIHAKKADTWKCNCGRYVLCDGLPCFCGQPAHRNQGRSQ